MWHEIIGINPQMDIYILSHGDWSIRLVENLQTHFGLLHNYYIFPLLEEDAFTEYLSQVIKHFKDNNSERVKVFIVDLMDSSTSRCALTLSYEFNFEISVLANLSLPLLLHLENYIDVGMEGFTSSIKKKNEKISFIELVDYYNLWRKD